MKCSLGFSLRQLQIGREPTSQTRSMSSIGQGVYELKEADERAWYRVIYLSKIGPSRLRVPQAAHRKAVPRMPWATAGSRRTQVDSPQSGPSSGTANRSAPVLKFKPNRWQQGDGCDEFLAI